MTIALTVEQRQALGDVSVIYQIPELAETPHSSTTLRFGLIADPQYADAEPSETHPRFYRNSLCKLSKAITELNDHHLEFVVTLGDLVDRDWASFEPRTILAIPFTQFGTLLDFGQTLSNRFAHLQRHHIGQSGSVFAQALCDTLQ